MAGLSHFKEDIDCNEPISFSSSALKSPQMIRDFKTPLVEQRVNKAGYCHNSSMHLRETCALLLYLNRAVELIRDLTG